MRPEEKAVLASLLSFHEGLRRLTVTERDRMLLVARKLDEVLAFALPPGSPQPEPPPIVRVPGRCPDCLTSVACGMRGMCWPE